MGGVIVMILVIIVIVVVLYSMLYQQQQVMLTILQYCISNASANYTVVLYSINSTTGACTSILVLVLTIVFISIIMIIIIINMLNNINSQQYRSLSLFHIQSCIEYTSIFLEIIFLFCGLTDNKVSSLLSFLNQTVIERTEN